jgi:hypothetical protein
VRRSHSHALLPDVQWPFGLIARLRQPIQFDAIDDDAVDLVFLHLLPAKTDNTQLSALALVSRTKRLNGVGTCSSGKHMGEFRGPGVGYFRRPPATR